MSSSEFIESLASSTFRRLSKLVERGSPEDGLKASQLAVRQFPNEPRIFALYCKALQRTGNYDKAISATKQGLRFAPTEHRLWSVLADCYFELGEFQSLDALLTAHVKVARTSPSGDVGRITNALGAHCLYSLYRTDVTTPKIEKIQKSALALLKKQTLPATRRNTIPRIGFLSADFNSHAVSYFLTGVLKHIDRDRFNVALYFNEHNRGEECYDDITDTLKSQSKYWTAFKNVSDAKAVASKIHKDQNDILIDLSGFTAGNFLAPLAYRPARVIASWIGYPYPIGGGITDYWLTDSRCDPAEIGNDKYYSTKVHRFERFFSSYEPRGLPQITQANAQTHEIVYGCFNNWLKFSNEMIETWAKILCAVPHSVLLLKNSSIKGGAKKAQLYEILKKNKIGKDRVRILDRTDSVTEHLEQYNQVHIALDTFPYNGTTTSCEALSMGVPMVCLQGKNHHSRVTASICHAAGFDEYVTHSTTEYILTAVNMASNVSKTCQKQNNRDKFLHSSVCDHEDMAREFEKFVSTAICALDMQ